jgi:glycosyltransferase involved in cell wall biosynthesis
MTKDLGNTKGDPAVSVCIPTYNGEKYLRKCLDSVLAQTFQDFEIRAVDDRSTDGTMDILEEYSKRDARVKVHRNERNQGIAPNWNRCVEVARGEWIKFVFQDDFITAECLEKMVAACSSGAHFAVCRRNIVFEESTENLRGIYRKYIEDLTMEKIFHGATVISPVLFCVAVLEYLDFNIVGEPTSVILHRSIFHKYGTFNPHLIQRCDHEFWLRVAIHAGLVYIPETLATFRVHKDSASVIHRERRRFRKDTIDELIFWHELSFNPAYLPLRRAAADRVPPVDFQGVLAKRVWEAEKIVSKSNKRSDPSCMSEWNDLLQCYPSLASINGDYLSIIWMKMNRKAKNLLSHWLNRRFGNFC